jgi:hypothetical protein
MDRINEHFFILSILCIHVKNLARDQDGIAASNSDTEALSPKVLLTCA